MNGAHPEIIWGVVLIEEIDAAVSLLRHGLGILADYRYAPWDLEALFACLAGGSEKLLKLSLGMAARADGKHWLTQREMRGFSHDIVRLNAAVRSAIDRRLQTSTAAGRLTHLIEDTTDDAYLNGIMFVLGEYAKSGRYDNLGLLASERPRSTDLYSFPSRLWRSLETRLAMEEPAVMELAATPDYRAERRELNDVLAGRIRRWFELIERSWSSGVFGPEAAQKSSMLELSLDRS